MSRFGVYVALAIFFISIVHIFYPKLRRYTDGTIPGYKAVLIDGEPRDRQD